MAKSDRKTTGGQQQRWRKIIYHVTHTQTWYFNELLDNCSMTATRGLHFLVPFSDVRRLSHLVVHFKSDRIYIEWLAILISIKVGSRRLSMIYRSDTTMSVCRLHPLCIMCLSWNWAVFFLAEFQRRHPDSNTNVLDRNVCWIEKFIAEPDTLFLRTFGIRTTILAYATRFLTLEIYKWYFMRHGVIYIGATVDLSDNL